MTCGEKFSWTQELKIHTAKIHDKVKIEVRTFKCCICTTSFPNSKQLKEHNELLHEGNELLDCSFCEGKFNSKRRLKTHLSVIHKQKQHYLYSFPVSFPPP